MQILQQHMPALKLTDLITWGTQNGASFLGIDDQFGTLRPGKKPGLNLITHVDGLKLTPDSKVKRLI
jgi:cytosine/adenosine deaminase-related metal-dependent hydrolase